MILLQINELKDFMNKLLMTDCFDSFLLEEACIKTAVTYTIDGHLNKDFYTTEEWEDTSLHPYPFICWKDMRALFFDLIKGKRTPAGFRFILHLMPEHISALLLKEDTAITPEQIRAFVLNIKYDGSAATITTGTALHTFLPDKTPDKIWDHTIIKFFAKKEINVDVL